MNLNTIAIANIKRRKAKAAFVLAGLLIAVTTVVALVGLRQAVSMNIIHQLEQYGANIVILPQSDSLALSYGGISMGGVSFDVRKIHEEELQKIYTIPYRQNLAAVGPVVLGVVQAQGQNVLLTGLDFDATVVLKPWWRIQGDIPGDNQVLLGAEAARLLGIGIGDSLSLEAGELSVTGILEPSGSQDDQLLFTDLRTAQVLLGKEGLVSMVEVAALCHGCPIDEMVEHISAALPGTQVMAIQQVVESRMQAMDHFEKFAYGVSGVVIVVSGLMVLVSMMGNVRERAGEIGVFRAIGYRRGHVMRIIFLEAGILALVGGLAGYLLGKALTQLTLPLFTIGEMDTVFHHGAHWDPLLLVSAVGLSVLVGLSASIYPAVMASRMDPNEALRAI
ncbi:putative ABC transport system permease protein [Desulfonatronum thiosulfatophilum]|uniref:Putative ABC transport system permease protein n=1 Tax=Desulfonatronum thiosulfatophilum TaxID=617002 RepID=A0A1G6C123_9BACT|nr:ABC transporter permease [Desulfonatronum thiosulfatophilum]SDB26583.1 putative ABC transport system permease protein [Desulfonatronum thiosulfatophilum]